MCRNTSLLFQTPSQIVPTYIPTSSCADRQPDCHKLSSHPPQSPYGCGGPSSPLSPSKSQMIYPNKASEHRELWVPHWLGQISGGRAEGQECHGDSWRHAGGCCTTQKFRGQSTPMPAAEERTQRQAAAKGWCDEEVRGIQPHRAPARE